jgi:hypothetical protein
MNRRIAVSTLVALLVLAAAPHFGAGKEPAATVAYDLFIGFNATRSAPAGDSPAVTELALETEVKGLRFVFGRREVDEDMTVNWYPVLGSGQAPSRPILSWMADGRMKAKVAPLQTTCDKKKAACWLTSQQENFQAVLAVLDVSEDVRDELLDPNISGQFEDTISLAPSVLHVTLLLHGHYAWACDCAAKGGEWGNTHNLDFYYALPIHQLKVGQQVSSEFPLECDDVDGPGTLTVGLIPTGSVKKR